MRRSQIAIDALKIFTIIFKDISIRLNLRISYKYNYSYANICNWKKKLLCNFFFKMFFQKKNISLLSGTRARVEMAGGWDGLNKQNQVYK